jgi:transcriptional regulator with XRE-family HTH domain
MARVKTIREALELSQEAFAERANLKYKHYQSVEAGRKSNIQLPTLEKLAKACGLELAELLDFRTDPVVLAEDRIKDGSQAGRGRRKGARQSPKT